jgi:hypothetical protein
MDHEEDNHAGTSRALRWPSRVAGGQIGANYQSGVFVVGFEVDTGPQATAEEMSYRLAGNSASAFFGNIREALFESVLAHNQRHEKVGQALPRTYAITYALTAPAFKKSITFPSSSRQAWRPSKPRAGAAS